MASSPDQTSNPAYPWEGAWPENVALEPPGSPRLADWARAWDEQLHGALAVDQAGPRASPAASALAPDAFGLAVRRTSGLLNLVSLLFGGAAAALAVFFALGPLAAMLGEGLSIQALILIPMGWGCAALCAVVALSIAGELAYRSQWLLEPERLRWRVVAPWRGSFGELRRETVAAAIHYTNYPNAVVNTWETACRLRNGTLVRLPLPRMPEKSAESFARHLAAWAGVPVERRETEPDDPLASPKRFLWIAPGDPAWRRRRSALARDRREPFSADARTVQVDYAGQERYVYLFAGLGAICKRRSKSAAVGGAVEKCGTLYNP